MATKVEPKTPADIKIGESVYEFKDNCIMCGQPTYKLKEGPRNDEAMGVKLAANVRNAGWHCQTCYMNYLRQSHPFAYDEILGRKRKHFEGKPIDKFEDNWGQWGGNPQ